MTDRPKSSTAQIIQATMSVALFGLAIFGYFYTVQPVYTRQRAEEAAARLEKEAATYRAEIDQNKIDLAYYEALTRRYVIEQFATRVTTKAEAVYIIFGIRKYYIDEIGGLASASPYRSKFDIWNLTVTRKESFSFKDTGGDIVRKSLDGDEFNLLSDKSRRELLARISKITNDDPVFSQPLGYQIETMLSAQTSKNGSWTFVPLSLEERTEVGERRKVERERFEAAHAAFVNAIDAMKKTLLEAP